MSWPGRYAIHVPRENSSAFQSCASVASTRASGTYCSISPADVVGARHVEHLGPGPEADEEAAFGTYELGREPVQAAAPADADEMIRCVLDERPDLVECPVWPSEAASRLGPLSSGHELDVAPGVQRAATTAAAALNCRRSA